MQPYEENIIPGWVSLVPLEGRFQHIFGHAMTHSELAMPRFLTPWRVEKIPGGYTVRDATDRVLARIYGQCEPKEGCVAALTLEEAEEMALTIAMLPQTLSESEKLHLRLAGQPL